MEPHQSIAILLDYLGAEMGTYIGGYQGSIFSGIRKELARRGVPWVTYVGHAVHDVNQNSAYRKANDLYRLIDPSRHAGMIVLTPAIGTHLSDAEFLDFLEPYHPLPIVGIGRKLPGIPTVLVDNTLGMQDLMEHLIVTRHFRRFVFMRGIAQHHDAQVREQVFRAALKRHSLDILEEHFLTGDFHSARAYTAMREFLLQRRDFEVVVCANDEMAFGVMQALQDHGLRVPTQVAVVGFDDIAEAQVRIPPLTTIRQPLQELGVEAVNLLLEGQGREEVFLGSQLVVRQSCGTLPGLEDMSTLPLTRENRLYQSLLDTVRQPECKGGFTAHWYELLLETVNLGDPLDPLQQQLMELQLQAQQNLSPALWPELTRTLLEGHRLLYEIQKVAQSRSYFSYTMTMIHQMRLDAELLSYQDLPSLLGGLKRYLDWLEVERYVLVLYDTFGPEPSATAHVALCSEAHPTEPSSFPTRQLVPDSMQDTLHQDTWFAMPLFINDEHYGLLLTGKHTKFNLDGDMPRYLISRALSQVVKVQAQSRYTESLEQQVKERTHELQQEVKERTRAEKALRVANQELQRSVLLDGLTGIFNRTAFNDHLKRMWKSHLDSSQPLSLILCDVDFFKKYNDLYGHLQGDSCLKQVAKAIERCARNREDMAARYGGEEFALILPETDLAGGMRVAERLQQELNALALPHAASEVSSQITVSMGLANLIPEHGTSPNLLIQQADLALYEAKHLGRNRVVHRSSETQEIMN
ncbi:diguanylate cyclase domain-containing protein [Deinococcus cellulosilyticus]|uniref:GGDEF domain-containing protein n=1 Tax=Deinococcus cellulosilyticus (strain DSM 18568 / NBRC 106333 / KACC 11606 / 5516J-15) TaxID=1223518 RepID=A0A511N8W5_DEIC1|nr:diguanylate cyclase [Deinococcus cellulosilyticus]GEM49293.1 hypothetical protein DC3_49280 [Deinococcus cellulosilyticus NBRC 106333 = KACC 11606]